MNNTEQIVRKVMDNLYVDPTEGFLLDYKVEVTNWGINSDEGSVIIHALIDHKTYWNDGTPTHQNPSGSGGYFNLMTFKNTVNEILKYVSITVDVKPYINDAPSDIKKYMKL
jgi:hypothetical protein